MLVAVVVDEVVDMVDGAVTVVVVAVVVVDVAVLVDRWELVVYALRPSVSEDATGGHVSACTFRHPLAHSVEELFGL